MAKALWVLVVAIAGSVGAAADSWIAIDLAPESAGAEEAHARRALGDPRSLEVADFDADGAPDAVVGLGDDRGGGWLIFLHGNADAQYPVTRSALDRRQSGAFSELPLLPGARWIRVWVRPDFLAGVHLDLDGNLDLAFAALHDARLATLAGDGTGFFGEPGYEPLPGRLVSLERGQWEGNDDLPDLAATLERDSGPAVLILEGALRNERQQRLLRSEERVDELAGWRNREPKVEAFPSVAPSAAAIATLARQLNPDSIADRFELMPLAGTPLRVRLSTPAGSFSVNALDDLDDGTCDATHCSLRDAINAANLSAAASEISFALAGSPPFVISPVAPFPAITVPVTIDGTTQPGYADAPIVVLDGTALDSGDGLTFLGDLATAAMVRALVIQSFPGHALHSANPDLFEFSPPLTVQGCFIGTDAAGSAAAPNGDGVYASGYFQSLSVGGLSEGEGNLISGNLGPAVSVSGLGNGGIIGAAGNRIGTDITGMVALGGQGVAVGLLCQACNAGEVSQNLISGVSGAALALNGNNALVTGNWIGVDESGELALANGSGVLAGTYTGTIGGALPASANVISGNTGAGVQIFTTSFGTPKVQGNRIGRSASGTASVGNGGAGVVISDGSPNTYVSILGNAIGDNSALGIDLGGDGVTANDVGDADSGPNGLQNFPDLTLAVTGGTAIHLRGTLSSEASTVYSLEFFASGACDGSGRGEGERFLGALQVTTGAAGSVGFEGELAAMVAGGESISSTATRVSTGATSEFSACTTASSADFLFIDGFEVGNTSRWSMTIP